MKTNHFPNVDGIPSNGFSIDQGGTFGLVGITPELVGKPNGVAVSTSLNLINPVNLDTSFTVGVPGIDGPVAGIETKVATFVITNYNFNKTYTVSSSDGVVSIDREVVKFTPSHFGDTSFKINDRVINFPVQQLIVTKPSIIAPVENTGLLNTVNVQSSVFDTGTFVDTHSSSDWQLSLVSDFSTILQSLSNSTTAKTAWNLVGLEVNKTYYVRVRHKGAILATSPWSETFEMKTALGSIINTPIITYPTNNLLNVAINITAQASAFSVSGWPDTLAATEWQLSASNAFTTLISQSTSSSWALPTLGYDTIYYIRVRRKGTLFGYSEWSEAIGFRTLVYVAPAIATPVVVGSSVLTGVLSTLTTTFSNFQIIGGTETHASSDWQLSLSSAFDTILQSVTSSTIFKLSWNLLGLQPSKVYYVRVRYNGTAQAVSFWSNALEIRTAANGIINTPTITAPINNATSVAINITAQASAFSVSGWPDTLAATEWQLSASNAFTTLISQSTSSSWTLPTLGYDTTYFLRVRQKGTLFGYSEWATPTSFKTTVYVAPYIVTPQYFGPSLETVSSTSISASFTSYQVVTSTEAHSGSYWQLCIDSGGSKVIVETLYGGPYTSYSKTDLQPNKVYYLRVMYQGTNGLQSQWSPYKGFLTGAAPVPVPVLPTLAYTGTRINSVTLIRDGSGTVIDSTINYTVTSNMAGTFNWSCAVVVNGAYVTGFLGDITTTAISGGYGSTRTISGGPTGSGIFESDATGSYSTGIARINF